MKTFVLPLDPHTHGRIRCRAKHSHASAAGTASRRLHHTPPAVPRVRSTTIHPLLPQPPPSTPSSPPSHSGNPRGPKSGPLEPPIRTTNRTSIRRHQDAGRSAGSLAGWQEGCRNPDTRRRGRASVGLDPPDPHPTHRTQTRRRPKPRTGPGSTPRRPTPSAPTLLPANHRVVRRLRRRTITHHHHRHARRHRSSRVLPPLQPASPTKSTGPSPCAKEVNSIGKQHL